MPGMPYWIAVPRTPSFLDVSAATLLWTERYEEQNNFRVWELCPNGQTEVPPVGVAGFADAETGEAVASALPGRDLDIEVAPHEPGIFHARLWRNGYQLSATHAENPAEPLDDMRRARRESAIAVRRLLDDLADIFEVIEPDPVNLGVYGPALRELLLLAATEFEAACKGALRALGYPLPDRSSTTQYVHLKTPMRLDEYRLRLSAYPELHGAFGEITPFADWDLARPTASLPWYDAYNLVKHDRDLHRTHASLENTVNAVAASYVMLLAQFGAPGAAVQHLASHRAAFNLTAQPRWGARDVYFPARAEGLRSAPLWTADGSSACACFRP